MYIYIHVLYINVYYIYTCIMYMYYIYSRCNTYYMYICIHPGRQRPPFEGPRPYINVEAQNRVLPQVPSRPD